MTEPKQSFTEEINKEAESRYRPFYNQSSYDENSLLRTSFIEGANVVLSILSRKTEGREFWIRDDGNWHMSAFTSQRKLDQSTTGEEESWSELHVIEYSALVAERAKRIEAEDRLRASDYAAKNAGEIALKLESELTTLRARADAFTELSNKLAAQLKLCKEQRNYLSLYRANDQYDCSDEIKQYDLELQNKGQGDE